MLIGISGPRCSGKNEAAKYLLNSGFRELQFDATDSRDNEAITFASKEELILYATQNWLLDHFIILDDLDLLKAAAARPFFLHLIVDAPMGTRFQRYRQRCPDAVLEKFMEESDSHMVKDQVFANVALSTVRVINNFSSVELFCKAIERLNLKDETRLRPTWDAYFMKIAEYSSMRSNCMKRRVGCVVVRNQRIVATGYNGTPKGLQNCKDKGCVRCNNALTCGTGLSTCLCLHAEENALLEAGRDRISGGVVYCNTCPCLTCTIKLIQSGVVEVVYSQSYSMDEESSKIFGEAGVKLRQYSPPRVFDIDINSL